jgi:multiple sugar transport system substrate-binding protein
MASVATFAPRLTYALVALALAITGPAFWPAGARAQAPERISFMVFGDAAERAAYERLVADFGRRHPSVQVVLVHVPGQGDYRKRLGIDFAAGMPADIVLLNYRRYAAFAAKGVLEPLGPYLARSAVLKEADFYPQAMEPFRWRGTVMCIPQNLSSLVVYYNRDLFDRAGVPRPTDDWTWDDLLHAAKALTRETKGIGGTGRVDQYGLGTEVSIFRVAPFIWQNGGELVDSHAAPTRLTLDAPAAREAVQWFVELQTRHRVVPDAAEEKSESSESRFLNGRLGMFLNSRRGVPTYRTITAFDWDVAALPRRRHRAGILHADAYCMPKAARNKAATWAFIEYANSPDGQRAIAGSGRTVPSLRQLAESPAFLDPAARPRNSRAFLTEIPHIRAVPVTEGWVDVEDLAGEELARAFYGRASVDEVIATAIRRAAPFFKPR